MEGSVGGSQISFPWQEGEDLGRLGWAELVS